MLAYPHITFRALLILLAGLAVLAALFYARKRVRLERRRRQQAQKELQESEARLRTIFETEPECVKVVSASGDLLAMNQAGIAMLEAEAFSDVRRNTLVKFINPQYRASFIALHKRVMQGESGILEFEVTGFKGTHRWLETHAAPLRDAMGKVEALLGVTRDITERKKVERELRESEEKYRLLFENAPVGFSSFDENGVTLTANPRLAEILEVPRERLLGADLVALFKNEKIRAALQDCLRGRLGNFEGAYHTVLAGKDIFVRAVFSPLFKADGSLGGGMAILEDITGRTRAEAASAKLEQRLTLALRAGDIGVWDWDLAKDEAFVDEKIAEIYGLPKAGPMAREEFQQFVHPEDHQKVWASLEKAIREKTYHSVDFRIVRRDGTVRWILAGEGVVLNDRQEVTRVVGVNIDVTQRKEAELTAEAAVRSKAKFLDIAAHELRTPITAFSLMLQVIRKQLASGSPLDVDLFDRLQAPANRMNRLVVDLLDMSRLERGLLVLRPEPTDMVSLIAECLAEFQVQWPQRKFAFIRPSQPLELDVDPVRINQILSNLLDNAIKYTPVDKPIEVVLESTPLRVQVSVIDQGAGISKEQQKELFLAFSRGSSDAAVRASGLGLGLSVSRGLIELHGGKIGVKSEEGRGSSFYFEIPRTGGRL